MGRAIAASDAGSIELDGRQIHVVRRVTREHVNKRLTREQVNKREEALRMKTVVGGGCALGSHPQDFASMQTRAYQPSFVITLLVRFLAS